MHRKGASPNAVRMMATLLLACATACGPSDSSPTGPPPISRGPSAQLRAWWSPEQGLAVDNFARLLAEGLEEPSARTALLSSLRTSPLFEHKIVLSDFLRSEAGLLVQGAVAERSHSTVAEVRALAEALPAADLYVAHPTHRRTWHSSEPIAVLALLDATSPLAAHMGSGALLPIPRWSAAPTPMAVLVLGPREASLNRRDSAYPGTDLRVIESEPTIENMKCLDDCGGGGGGGPPPDTTSLWIDQLVTHNVYDNGFEWETNEFELRSTASNGVAQTWRCEGIGHDDNVIVASRCSQGTVVNSYSPFEVSYVDVEAVETDFFADDHWSDWLTPPPGFAISSPHVTSSDSHNVGRTRSYVLYQYPQGCSPGDPFCPQIELKFRW